MRSFLNMILATLRESPKKVSLEFYGPNSVSADFENFITK